MVFAEGKVARCELPSMALMTPIDEVAINFAQFDALPIQSKLLRKNAVSFVLAFVTVRNHCCIVQHRFHYLA